MKKVLLKIKNWFSFFKKAELQYPVLYQKAGNAIKSTHFSSVLPVVGIFLTNEVIYYPLAKDYSYRDSREGFYNSKYYGTWEEAQAFFDKVKVPGYKAVAAPIDVLIGILNDYRNINPFLKKFGLEPLHEDWYYWSGTSYKDDERYAWDYCNDRTGNGKDECAKSAYLRTEKNHFLGILIPE